MVAVGASLIVLLGVAVVMNMGMSEFMVIFDHNKTMDSVDRAAFALKSIVQNGVNVRGSTDAAWGDPDPTQGYAGVALLPSGNPGFDSALTTAAPPGNVAANNGKAYKIVVFLVENGSYSNTDATAGIHAFNPALDGSSMRAVAIWYQVPDSTKAGPNSSGALWIKTNANGAFTPQSSDLVFNRLSAFKMEVIPTPATPPNPTGPVYKIVFTLTGRYFKGSDKSLWTYDNPASACLTGCRDMEPRAIEVTLRDNALATSQIAADGVIERSQGPLYYFQLHTPRQGQFVNSVSQ